VHVGYDPETVIVDSPSDWAAGPARENLSLCVGCFIAIRAYRMTQMNHFTIDNRQAHGRHSRIHDCPA
jgi:hypothetical protein